MSEEQPLEPGRFSKPSRRTGVIVLLTALAAFGLDQLLADQMPVPGRRAVVIFLFAAVFWAAELIPLYATSMLVVVVCIFLLAEEGGLAAEGGVDYTTFLDPFASNVIMLFLGGLMLSAAVTRHNLHLTLAAYALRPFMTRPRRLLLAVVFVTGLASMWMSNTATAAMMLTVLGPVLSRGEQRTDLDRALLLAVPFAANLGGVGTPIGTPPNAIALGALRQAGIEITFLAWMLMALPLALLLLSLLAAILLYRFKPPARVELDDDARKPPPTMTPKARATAGVLIAAAALWLTGALHGLPDGVVALAAGAALVALGLIDRKEVNGIEWTVLLLMWGGLALSRAMETTGVVASLVQHLPETVGLLFAISLMVAACAVSTFMSNTATAALLVPIVLSMNAPEAPHMAVLTAFACSFAMAMPVSTPPNALAFASGKLRAKDVIRMGTVVSVISLLLTIAGYRLMLPRFVPLS